MKQPSRGDVSNPPRGHNPHAAAMPFPPISNFCAHTDNRGRRVFKVECSICTPQEYRCLFCLQGAVDTRHGVTKCYKSADGKHVSVDGNNRDALCVLCWSKIIVEAVVGSTICTLDRHVLAVYPFTCEVCKGSVSLERPTWCDGSYTGQHLLRERGFIDLGLKKAPLPPHESHAAEIDALIKQLQGKRLTRRFVTVIKGKGRR